MKEPIPLYVDEISHDRIKATVTDVNSFHSNLQVLQYLIPRSEPIMATFRYYRSYIGESINGINIMPLGRFICMMTGSTGNRGMVLLDLIGKEELAEKIAEKLDHVDLRDRFMQVYEEILDHPENHGKCKLVVGKGGWPRRPPGQS